MPAVDAVLDVLAASPLLTIFLVVALGTALGAVPFGPVRFGAAGALFVGLAVGALDPRLGEGLALVQTLGLALFVYTVGLAAGSTFFRDLRRQLPLMTVGVAVLAVAAATAVLLGGLAGLSGPLRAGAFTGALTSTPALAAATTASGSTEPAIGYALGYPLGVTVAIVVVAVVLGRRWPSRRDPEPAAGLGLDAVTARVDRPTLLSAVPGFADGQVRMSYLSREGRTRVVAPDEQLQPGDRVVVVGPSVAVAAAVVHLSTLLTEHLAHDRTSVDHRRPVVREVLGQQGAEVPDGGGHRHARPHHDHPVTWLQLLVGRHHPGAPLPGQVGHPHLPVGEPGDFGEQGGPVHPGGHGVEPQSSGRFRAG